MRIPNPYFNNIPTIGNLSLDHIFLEDSYPVLFSCINNDKHLYICVCCDVIKEQRWLIAPIDLNKLSKLIDNKISLHDIFKLATGNGCVATWTPSQKHENFYIMNCNNFDDEDLPVQGIYLDDDGESNNYIQLLKNREINYKEKDLIKLLLDNICKKTTINIINSAELFKRNIQKEDEFTNLILNHKKTVVNTIKDSNAFKEFMIIEEVKKSSLTDVLNSNVYKNLSDDVLKQKNSAKDDTLKLAS